MPQTKNISRFFSVWRGSFLNEEPDSHAKPFSERELQQLWFEHLLPSTLETLSGEPVKIIQAGWWNQEGGPDFRDAAFQVGEQAVLLGDMEMHLDASDWERHGHHLDSEYNRVVLHVSLKGAPGTTHVRLQNGARVPTVALEHFLGSDWFGLSRECLSHAAVPRSAMPGRCAEWVGRMEEASLHALLQEAGMHRLQVKGARMLRQICRDGREQVLWEALAEALGYKENKMPFRLLARLCPWREIAGLPPAQREARLFGVAGFLPEVEITTLKKDGRTHASKLWREWWQMREGLSGQAPFFPAKIWKGRNTRPANHPQRRVAALSIVAGILPEMLSALNERNWREATRRMAKMRHPFFDCHATLKSPALESGEALVGASRLAEIQINVFAPWLLAADPQAGAELIASMPTAQSNALTKLAYERIIGTQRPTFRAKTPVEQQGLIEIYSRFCSRDESGCAACFFPEGLCRLREDAAG